MQSVRVAVLTMIICAIAGATLFAAGAIFFKYMIQ
jgi:hypothetical protein